MKKFSSLILFTSLLTISSLSLFSHNSDVFKANAENVHKEYVDLGPGIFNPNQDNTPIERFGPNNYSLAYRGGTDVGAIMLYPNCDIYKDIDFNTAVPANELVDTDFSLIRIYTSEVTYHTIDYYFAYNSPVSYNIFADAALNVSIFLNRTKLPTWNIYKVVISEGFAFPYASNDHSTQYVLKETMTFKYNFYHNEAKEDIVESYDWTKTYSSETEVEPEEEEGIKVIPIAAFNVTSSRQPGSALENYRFQIRGGNITQEDFDHPETNLNIDDGSCWAYFFFGDNDYNPEINNNRNIPVPAQYFDISDSEDSYINQLYKKVIFTTADGNELTLLDVANPFTKGMPSYNIGGEYGCIGFKIGNEDAPDDISYNAMSFTSVKVLRGAQFPSFRYTSGQSKTEYRYEQLDDISLVFSTFKYVKWSTYSEFNFNAANIEVASIGARNINNEELGIKGVSLDLLLSECNYGDEENKKIIAIGENMTRYIYVNGRSIHHLFGESNITAYANLEGKKDTISVIIPMNDISEINEIIVERGCSIPSLVASSITIEIYVNYVSYCVINTSPYTNKNNEFVRSEKLYWTLWFDGKNPIRVLNGSTFDFSESAPQGDSNEKQKFVRWLDEAGFEVKGYSRITTGFELYGQYTFIYKVEFKNIDHEFSLSVDKNTRLSNLKEVQKALIPTRKGYSFQGYVDQDGNRYNINNRVTRDLVLTATWISTEEVVTTTSVNTPLVIGIIIASLAGLVIIADITLIFIFKKKK